MKKQKPAEERYLDILNHLSQRKRGFSNINDILYKFNSSTAIGRVLKEKNLIEKNKNGLWQWTGEKPGMLMAMGVLHSVNSNINHSASLQKRKSKPVIQKQKPNQMNTQNTTAEKYLNFLNYLYSRKRGVTTMQDVIAKFKICTTVRTVVKKQGLMEKQNGAYKWISTAPNMDTAKQVLKGVNDHINKCIAAKRGNVQTKTVNAPVVAARKYSTLNILNIEDLLAQKTELSNKIQKIDMLLEAVENFKS